MSITGAHSGRVQNEPNDPTELAHHLGAAKFVSLVTYKRDGTAVAAPMWIAQDGTDLVAWTPADAWKVKRIKRDPRVVLIESTRTGKVDPVAPELWGTAVIDDAPHAVSKVEHAIRRKYGVEFTVVTTIEAIVARGRKPRVAVRITPQRAVTKHQ